MNNQIQSAVQDFVMLLVTGILGLLAAFLIALAKKGFDWLTVKITSIKSETVRKETQDAINKLHSLVITTVTSLQQTLGDEIRESIKNDDGNYTREDLLALKDSAVSIVTNNLDQSLVELLNSVYPNLQNIIEDLVEEQVYLLKMNAFTSEVLEIKE